MDVIDSALIVPVDSDISLKLIEGVVEYQLANKAMAKLMPIIQNQKTGGLYEALTDVVQEYSDLVSMADSPDQLQDCELSYAEAIKFRALDSGMAWPLKILNDTIGGIEPSLGLVFARPDVGKTSFMLNCIAYWSAILKSTDRQMLYCGNEEGIINLKARMGVSLLGCDTRWAEENSDEFGKQVLQKSGDCVRWHGGVKSTRDVETLVKRYEPVVTILDQLPKFVLPGNKAEGPQALANVYMWFRERAIPLNTAFFGVCQAGFTAENKQWPNMSDINASKTDVPGELDWAIGLGFLNDPGMEFIRFVNVCKNKKKYGRKGRKQVTFNPDKCRFKQA